MSGVKVLKLVRKITANIFGTQKLVILCIARFWIKEELGQAIFVLYVIELLFLHNFGLVMPRQLGKMDWQIFDLSFLHKIPDFYILNLSI